MWNKISIGQSMDNFSSFNTSESSKILDMARRAVEGRLIDADPLHKIIEEATQRSKEIGDSDPATAILLKRLVAELNNQKEKNNNAALTLALIHVLFVEQ